MTLPEDLGPVLLLRVHKAPPPLPPPLGPLAPDAWFCRWLQLEPPQGAPLRFPCYQWLEGAGTLVLREGPGERRGGRRKGTGGGVNVALGLGGHWCGHRVGREKAEESRPAGATRGSGEGGD